MKHRWLWILLPFVGLATAEPLPRSDWVSSTSANRKFVTGARNAQDVQNLGVWAVRGLEDLEKTLGLRVPFSPGQTIALNVLPDVEVVHLRELPGGNQEILIPENDFSRQALAEAFVRACVHLLLHAAVSEKAVNAPEWLVSGLAHTLLQGETKRLYELSLEPGLWNRFPPPETLMRRAVGATDDRLLAAHVWIVRWLFRGDGPARKDRAAFWRTLALDPYPGAETWIGWAGVTDLRDLHLHWDLWRMSQERSLMTEFRLETLAQRRLDELLNFRPAEFGLDGELPRHQPIQLTDLIPYLDEAWVPSFLSQWMVRLQALRFRQSEAFVEQTEKLHEAAGKLLAATGKKGKHRERRMSEFERLWRDAQAMMKSE